MNQNQQTSEEIADGILNEVAAYEMIDLLKGLRMNLRRLFALTALTSNKVQDSQFMVGQIQDRLNRITNKKERKV
jgi:hypothetical protein